MFMAVKAKGLVAPQLHSKAGGREDLQIATGEHCKEKEAGFAYKGWDLVPFSTGSRIACALVSSPEAWKFTLPAVPLIGKVRTC